MSEDQQTTNDEDNALWQTYQSRQNNHADADGPDDLQNSKAVCDVKRPGEIEDDELGEDQPEAECQKKKRCCLPRPVCSIEKGQCAGQKNKDRPVSDWRGYT